MSTASSGMPGPRVWVDGHLVGDGPSLDALDHGVTVGDGVFETVKVVEGRVFALRRHHDRMDRSLGGLGLPPLDRDRVQEGIEAVLAVAPMRFGRLRYTVTAGPGPLGSDRLGGASTYLVTAVEQDPPPRTAVVAVVPWTRNERGALAGVKSTSYAENVVALAAAKARGASEALLANTAGQLCEGTGSNVFVVVDGAVLTPRLEDGPLAGVTRDLALRWLREEGLDVAEDSLPMSVLDRAEEVWITSSVRDVCAVTRVDVVPGARSVGGLPLPIPPVTPRVLGEGAGPVTRRAQEVFARRAAVDPDP